MILEQLKNWKGAVEINGTKYESINEASVVDFKTLGSEVCIVLHSANKNAVQSITERSNDTPDSSKVYKISVRQYMTKKSTPSFDFMAKWNNDNPMPLRTMVGTVEKETRGMVYMNLHGDITAKETQICMKCGKVLTNPVSRFFGMGPECGGHNYVNPFESDEELRETVETYRKEHLQKITWSGWIIKSAIEEKEELN